ncbi:MAG: hypothetical protein ACRD4S_14760 [Candidatus Acidiferrales bacterium]
MTLGIGVLCDGGETIVLGSEKRASYGATENVQINPNDEAGKQYRLKPHKIFVCVAGSLSTCHAVYSQFAHLVDDFKDPINISAETLMALIDKARCHELKRIYDWEIKKKMGVSLHEWAIGKLPHGVKMHKLIVQYGLSILEQTPFKCELIVGGFIGDHGIFFKASQKENLQEETSPGVYAIGIGQVAAMRHLNKRGQNIHMGLPRTLLHVYESLYLSQSQYVGPPPPLLVIITKREPRIMVYPTRLLENWRKAYQNRTTTASLDDSGVAAKDVSSRLRLLKEADAS